MARDDFHPAGMEKVLCSRGLISKKQDEVTDNTTYVDPKVDELTSGLASPIFQLSFDRFSDVRS